MKRSSYNPDIHHRRSIRLRGYDYSQPNAYFFTVCVQNRELLLVPQDVQDMVRIWWNSLPGKFATVELDEFCIMPNHIHGIVVILGRIDKTVGATLRGRPSNIFYSRAATWGCPYILAFSIFFAPSCALCG